MMKFFLVFGDGAPRMVIVPDSRRATLIQAFRRKFSAELAALPAPLDDDDIVINEEYTRPTDGRVMWVRLDEDDFGAIAEQTRLEFKQRVVRTAEPARGRGTAGGHGHAAAQDAAEEGEYEEGRQGEPSDVMDRWNRRRTDDDPHVPYIYKIPALPANVMEALSSPFELSNAHRSTIVRIVAWDMLEKYCTDYYPTAREYDRAVTGILTEYPQLSDVVAAERTGGRAGLQARVASGEEGSSWRKQLNQRFKTIRQELIARQDRAGLKQGQDEDKSLVLRVRKSHTRGRHKQAAETQQGDDADGATDPDAPPGADRARRMKRPTPVEQQFDKGLSAGDVARDQARLQELQDAPESRLRDEETERIMRRSTLYRRTWILSTHEPWWRVQEAYPVLRSRAEIKRELRRQKGPAFLTSIDSFFTPAKKTTVMKHLERMKSVPLQLLLTKARAAAHAHGGCPELWSIVASFPFLAREGAKWEKQWIADDATLGKGVPFVRVNTSSRRSWEEGARFIPYIDGLPACDDQNLSLPDCFEVLVEVMSLTDIEVNLEVACTWRLLAEVVMGCRDLGWQGDRKSSRGGSSFIIARNTLLRE